MGEILKYELTGYSNIDNDGVLRDKIPIDQRSQFFDDINWLTRNTWSGYLTKVDNGVSSEPSWNIRMKNPNFGFGLITDVVFGEGVLNFSFETILQQDPELFLEFKLNVDPDDESIYTGTVSVDFRDENENTQTGFVGFTIKPKDATLYFEY